MTSSHNKYRDTPIMVYGTKKAVSTAFEVLDKLELTGDKMKDCLLIQQAMDEGRLKADCLYDGKTVYPYYKLVKEFKRFIETGSIEKMSKLMYKFLYLNFDIAHYNYNGYIAYYDGKWERLYNETLVHKFSLPYHCNEYDATGRIVKSVIDMVSGKDISLSSSSKGKSRKKHDKNVYDNEEILLSKSKLASGQMTLFDLIA